MEQQHNRITPPSRPRHGPIRPARWASTAGALLVAAIAALASYTHMCALALRYGQPELIADLLPASVDGLMAVAPAPRPPATAALGDGRARRWTAWLAFWTGVTASIAANLLAAGPQLIARCISAWPALAFVLVVEILTTAGPAAAPAGEQPPTNDQAPPSPVPVQREPSARKARAQAPHPPEAKKPAAAKVRRPVRQTRELAAKVRADNPDLTQAEVARQLGISATRLRQIDQTELRPPPANDHHPTTGEVPP
jgi:hypothetical protein